MTGETPVAPKKSLESVDRTVRILHAFGAEQEFTLAEVARKAELNEATALRYLGSLAAHGLVERTDAGRYRLGWELFRLGQLAGANRVPRAIALPVMEQLLEQYNETVSLALRQHDQCVLVEVLEGVRTVKKVNEVGQQDHWHASALGKAILSTLDEADRTSLVRRTGLRRLTDRTLTTLEDLERDLALTRERGYSLDLQENEDDLTCVGAPVVGDDGRPLFALSVSFLTHRLGPNDVEAAGGVIREAARDLGSRLTAGRARDGGR